ncbi:DUF3140 domain-containing protein [Rhodotorula paludigena]|uniref:DUF3140 domain-containing protein n=1 Tax=Rhodotorula paludigena TaxID=86838 RepID=UPI0031790C02
MGGKSDDQVIKEFNEYVNMTADELREWLETEDSQSSGWSKDNSGKVESGQESVGHESGRKIIDILERNPDKDPEQYTDEDLEHMRRVASYCKRHMAQEQHMVDEKEPEELEQTKSYRSLKNWGHDSLK